MTLVPPAVVCESIRVVGGTAGDLFFMQFNHLRSGSRRYPTGMPDPAERVESHSS